MNSIPNWSIQTNGRLVSYNNKKFRILQDIYFIGNLTSQSTIVDEEEKGRPCCSSKTSILAGTGLLSKGEVPKMNGLKYQDSKMVVLISTAVSDDFKD